MGGELNPMKVPGMGVSPRARKGIVGATDRS